MPGHSCFLRDGGEVFHTYSAFGRGNEYTPSLYTLLDLTALGRQEAWEEPKGRAPVLHDTQQGIRSLPCALRLGSHYAARWLGPGGHVIGNYPLIRCPTFAP
jgi:hypothetical protein